MIHLQYKSGKSCPVFDRTYIAPCSYINSFWEIVYCTPVANELRPCKLPLGPDIPIFDVFRSAIYDIV